MITCEMQIRPREEKLSSKVEAQNKSGGSFSLSRNFTQARCLSALAFLKSFFTGMFKNSTGNFEYVDRNFAF